MKIVPSISLKSLRTINADCTTIYLPEVHPRLRNVKPEKRISHNLRNMSSQTASQLRQFLAQESNALRLDCTFLTDMVDCLTKASSLGKVVIPID